MIILCLIAAVVCVVAVQAEECFDRQAVKKEFRLYLDECKEKEWDKVANSTTKAGTVEIIGGCVLRKIAIEHENKTVYNILLATINLKFTSETKTKIVLDAVEDCKYKHPDLTDELNKCYGSVLGKECFESPDYFDD